MYKYLSTVAIIAAIVVLCYTEESSICSRKNAGNVATFVRDSNNCSVYHICVLGRSMGELACPSDLVFSITYNVCVRKGQERDDCNKTSSLGGVSDDVLCNDYPNGNNRNPENCHSYIPCFNHTSRTVMQCPDRLHFSLKLQRCVLAKEANCKLEKSKN
ncbi:uncharacterized protein LOC106869807 [Octopus bimaculoides]|uniref:Chitin-binding type-2 domain-containing protein n=1 Tax=Octopus bimaculoides TaxID=37653 RepID=A0A0L8HMF1_OCTBM|nr:uncharacterized protein LOC106869807 [Octopus bimaculoides]|eukprot:XP_014771153.1 PREDICTED: uncharacterized protein LOC106869807 [Octopus bimaculoides]